METRNTLAKLSKEKIELLKSNAELELNSLQEDELLQKYQDKLFDLRKEGVNKILELQKNIFFAKKDKMLKETERLKLIAKYKNQILQAKEVKKENSAQEKTITKDALVYSNILAKKFVKKVNAKQNARLYEIKTLHAEKLKQIKDDYCKRITNATNKQEKATARYEFKSALFDAKNHYKTEVNRCSDAKRKASINHVQENRYLRNGKSNFVENIQMNIMNYVYNFNLAQFLLNNSLYLSILLFFIICIIVAPITGAGHLLTLPNLFTILEQSSTRMFYALGVAGLILIAGTDLSIGRMVAMGSVITSIILHPGINIVKFFNIGPWDFSSLPMSFRLILALLLSIFFCVLFSSFAGFFSAKLKMHPFISTLATQLIIYGLLFFGTTGTPVGSIDSEIKDLIGGRWIIGFINGELVTFPKLIIPAIVAIIVAWFIWNKTIFGKNMYAVGGNAEAAAVSGINIFWVTMGVFIMAGIFYGAGAFLEAFRANASAGTGQGYEMDAIAACVVGGISFNGGIGKISGATVGVIIFTGLTYCLTFLHIDTNLQFVFKGLIIIAAVALDSVKYLKRK